MVKKEIWLHGTKEEAAKDIIKKKKFDIKNPINGHNWGEGVYFTNDEGIAKSYGDTIVEVEVNMDLIWNFTYKEQVAILMALYGRFVGVSIPGEKMKELTREQKKIGVVKAQELRSKKKKLCIYDQEYIRIIGMRKSTQ